jgi:pimeloyl-ACP methyl ester carboxylesterase
MSHDAVPSSGPATEHSVTVPGGTIYYRTEGSGPPLVLIGGGPSNADTLGALAGHLATGRTVITYDRRGSSRSRLDDPSQPASIAVHADDVRHVLDHLGAGPASVFATSVGALIGLELAAAHPAALARVIVHEPPLGQLVPADDQASFDVELDRDDAGRALDQIAESIGVTRGHSLTGSDDRPEARRDDIELFIHRDVAAIADYQLDLNHITPLADQIVLTASEDGRAFYPHRCAEALAAAPGPVQTAAPSQRTRMTHPRRSTRITGSHRYHEAVRPCAPHRYSAPHGSGRLGVSLPRTTAGQCCATGRPQARSDRFPRSTPEPGPSSRHLHAGHHLANRQAPARLIPGRHTKPGFDVFRSVSTRHQWFALARLLDPHLARSRRAFSRNAQHPGS